MPEFVLQTFEHVENDGADRAVFYYSDQSEDEFFLVQVRERAAVLWPGRVGCAAVGLEKWAGLLVEGERFLFLPRNKEAVCHFLF